MRTRSVWVVSIVPVASDVVVMKLRAQGEERLL